MQWKNLENDHNSSLSLKPSPNLEFLVNHFNNSSPENSNYPEKNYSLKLWRWGNAEHQTPHKTKSLSIFHINVYSLKSLDDLQHILSCTKKDFDMTAISKTRITRQVLTNLNFNNYSFELPTFL